MSEQLWAPSPDRIQSTRLAEFFAQLPNLAGKPMDYNAMWEWSVQDIGAFWQAVWSFCGVVGETGETALDASGHIMDAQFFPNGRLNYAENLLQMSGSTDALIFHSESGAREVWSWDHLRGEVSKAQQALSALGVGKGDRVAGIVPNTPYSIAAMLAAASLGAVWSSCSPDFGVNGIHDRFGQIEPKVVFCADGYHYNGKYFDSVSLASEIASLIPSVQQVVVFPHIEEVPDVSALKGKGQVWADFVGAYQVKPLGFERVAFNDPLFILFSSGTTGLPKCIVHSVGGMVLQHLKEHQLHADLKAGDKLFYFTTCGWMMWNWLVSGLASGATLVLFDGSPFYPDGNRLADICAFDNVTHFGTSAKYLDACAKTDVKPAKTHDLSALQAIFSTGSPLAPEGFDYVYRDWKADVCLSSVAGGTDIAGCFVGGSPISPVYRGQCQQRLLGMDIQVYDENGQALQGEPGELVCAAPHPSQPVGFWNDPDRAKYRAAYFEKFDGVWHHGDWVTLTDEGGMIFFGRSDAVLNPGGVRIGTAEIYRQVERVEEVLEGLVIGQQWDNDVRVVLFVRLRDGVVLTDELVKRIKTEIRENATPRHVPAKVIAVADIPRTKSGKITELAVRDVVHGRVVKNTEAMANPEALDLYKDLAELQS